MLCPYCQTENREDRERCYVCDKDISMLRLVVNKARQHFNDALEHAERGRTTEAIDELKNALELDSKFVNARVVLGTLYAKNGDFDSAREAWHAALGVNPELSKAHAYLQRVEVAQTSLPALRAFRWASFALIVMIIALGAALVYAMRPDSALPLLREARQHYLNGSYGKAIKALEAVRKERGANEAAILAANSLHSALQADLRQQVLRIQDLKLRELYPEALNKIAELESNQPDNATSAVLAAVRHDISFYYRQQIDKLFEKFQRGDVNLADLTQQIESFTRLYPDSEEKEQLTAYIARARELEAENAVNTLRLQFVENLDFNNAVESLRQLAQQFPGSPAFAESRAVLIDEMLSYMFDYFQDLIDRRDFSQAEDLLAEITDLSAEFRDVVDVSGPVDFAMRVLDDARRAALFADAEDLLNRRDFEGAEEALWYLSFEPDLSGAELELLESYWMRALKSEGTAELSQWREIEYQFQTLEISDQQASETLSQYPDVLTLLNRKADRARVLGYAAASAVKLKNFDMATSLVRELKNLDIATSFSRSIESLLSDAIKNGSENESVQQPIEPTPRPARQGVRRPGSRSQSERRRP